MKHITRCRHPYAVQPLGNRVLPNACRCCRAGGLGILAKVRDKILVKILHACSASDLGVLVCVSHFLCALGHHSNLWRVRVLYEFARDMHFDRTWKDTYVLARCRAHNKNKGGKRPSISGYSYTPHTPFALRGVYSDELFLSWRCANMYLHKEWIDTDNIERRSNLSVREFIEQYESKLQFSPLSQNHINTYSDKLVPY